jgi:UPF0755 protein
MRGLKKIVLVGLIFILGMAVVVGLFFIKYTNVVNHPLSVDTDKVTINVDSGMTFYSLLDQLVEEDIIKDKNFVKLAIKYNDISTQIKAGQYTLDSTLSLAQLLQALENGAISDDYIKVTIPEGYSIETIASLLEDNGLITKDVFLDVCLNYELPKYINENEELKYNLEGYLFPDTYLFNTDSSAEEIINKLISRFEIIIEEVKEEYNVDIEDLNKVMTIASIVEKEAKAPEERSVIASVINNRILKNMPLQIDATVLYAIGEHKDKLLYSDLEVESVYNTYLHKGLTPGPICNPGRQSIEAALNPCESNYLYYVYDVEGKHYFTDNYNDFLEAKNRYKSNNY